AISPFFALFERQNDAIQSLQEELLQYRDETVRERVDIAYENDDLRRQIGALSDEVAVTSISPLSTIRPRNEEPNILSELDRVRAEMDQLRNSISARNELDQRRDQQMEDRIRSAMATASSEQRNHTAKLERECFTLREEVHSLKSELINTRLLLKTVQLQLSHFVTKDGQKVNGQRQGRTQGSGEVAHQKPEEVGLGIYSPRRSRSNSSGDSDSKGPTSDSSTKL
ncbi:hypothetical protein HDU67_003943, partial [Dinochytrium kinnereticum]